jgi:hypothetical protein
MNEIELAHACCPLSRSGEIDAVALGPHPPPSAPRLPALRLLATPPAALGGPRRRASRLRTDGLRASGHRRAACFLGPRAGPPLLDAFPPPSAARRRTQGTATCIREKGERIEIEEKRKNERRGRC